MCFNRLFFKTEKLPLLFICRSNIVATSQMVQNLPQSILNKYKLPRQCYEQSKNFFFFFWHRCSVSIEFRSLAISNVEDYWNCIIWLVNVADLLKSLKFWIPVSVWIFTVLSSCFSSSQKNLNKKSQQDFCHSSTIRSRKCKNKDSKAEWLHRPICTLLYRNLRMLIGDLVSSLNWWSLARVINLSFMVLSVENRDCQATTGHCKL